MKIYAKIIGTILIPAALSVAAMSGCTKERGPQGDPIPVKVTLPTRTVIFDTPGDDIATVRIIVFKAGADRIESNRLYTAAELTASGTAGTFGTTELSLYTGTYDFFVVANEKDVYSGALEQARTRSDIEAVRVSQVVYEEGELRDTEFPAGKIIPEVSVMPWMRSAYVRNVRVGNLYGDDANPVNVNNTGWRADIPMPLDRVASRINLYIRKMTTEPKDRFCISYLRLIQLPNYAFMVPAAYNSTQYNSAEWYKFDGTPEPNDYFQLNNNGGVEGENPVTHEPMPTVAYTPEGTSDKQIYAVSNRSNIIIPEYIMNDNTDPDKAVALEIRANYQKYAGVVDGEDSWEEFNDVWAIVPLPTGGTKAAPTYDILRNTDNIVYLTITDMHGYTFVPQVNLVVASWDEHEHGYYNAGNGNLSLGGNWTAGGGLATPDASGRVNLTAGQQAEFGFAFARSGGDQSVVRWKAVLSNPVDFRLSTTGGAATGGYAWPGDACRIRVTPAGASSTRNKTEIYINVDNGTGGIMRLKLDPSRDYEIYQNL